MGVADTAITVTDKMKYRKCMLNGRMLQVTPENQRERISATDQGLEYDISANANLIDLPEEIADVDRKLLPSAERSRASCFVLL